MLEAVGVEVAVCVAEPVTLPVPLGDAPAEKVVVLLTVALRVPVRVTVADTVALPVLLGVATAD